MSLEKIVRPFQSGGVFNPRTLPPSQPGAVVQADDTSTLSWAGGTAGDYITDPDPWLYNIEPSANLWAEDKTRRQSEVVRVENPDDSDQYVEIQRIKQTVFKKRSTGEELQIGLDWDKDRK